MSAEYIPDLVRLVGHPGADRVEHCIPLRLVCGGEAVEEEVEEVVLPEKGACVPGGVREEAEEREGEVGGREFVADVSEEEWNNASCNEGVGMARRVGGEVVDGHQELVLWLFFRDVVKEMDERRDEAIGGEVGEGLLVHAEVGKCENE